MENAPCKNCEKRYTGCHAKCEKYKEFNKSRELLRYQRMLEGHAHWAGVKTTREQ